MNDYNHNSSLYAVDPAPEPHTPYLAAPNPGKLLVQPYTLSDPDTPATCRGLRPKP